MDKATRNFSLTSPFRSPVEHFFQSHADVRASKRQALLHEELPQWEAVAPPDDTLTEMEGLARNPNATGAYAGSF